MMSWSVCLDLFSRILVLMRKIWLCLSQCGDLDGQVNSTDCLLSIRWCDLAFGILLYVYIPLLQNSFKLPVIKEPQPLLGNIDSYMTTLIFLSSYSRRRKGQTNHQGYGYIHTPVFERIDITQGSEFWRYCF
jgi:hypothetical protein